jgi:hypothetical protein
MCYSAKVEQREWEKSGEGVRAPYHEQASTHFRY